MKKLIRIATRKSQLALWQANFVKQALEKNTPGLQVELVAMTTEGDRRLDDALTEIGGKNLFVKELELAIEQNRADIAVHSMKDVPVELPAGFIMPAILARANPFDALVSNKFSSLDELPHGAVIGTSSLRRACQLKALRADLQIKVLRGNVNTRLRKLDENEYDAIILAVAGLERLQLSTRISSILSADISMPAAGQGAIGIECLAHDDELVQLMRALDHAETRNCVTAERAVNRHLGGNCQIPIGAFATLEKDRLYLHGIVGKPDGSLILRSVKEGAAEEAEKLGIALADDLIQQGAREILQALKIS